MNFLGHLYFSGNNLELMYANLFGDHVKGKDLSNFHPLVRSGIQLHRSIDNYIDHHPIVLDLMHQLYPELPKVTGLAIDLFFDHLLAKNWNKFHAVPYSVFLNDFYNFQPIHWKEYTDDFKFLIAKIRKYNWMNYYPDFEGLEKACQGVSSRISFKNQLINAPSIYIKHEEKITKCFYAYMEEATPFFKEKTDLIVQ